MIRRDLIKGGFGFVLLGGTAGCAGSDRPLGNLESGTGPATSQSNAISRARRSVPLGATVGSLVGSGYAIPVYVEYASVAPPTVRNDFSDFVSVPNLTRRSVAVSSYLDFRVSDARSVDIDVNLAVARDVEADRRNVAALNSTVFALVQAFEASQQTNEKLLSEILRERDAWAEAAEALLEERDRAASSASCYRGAEEQVLDRRSAGAEVLSEQMRKTQAELRQFFSEGAENALQLLRGR